MVKLNFEKPTATRDGYGAGLYLAGDADERIVALDADLAESTRSLWFGEKHPDRFFQMGIAEQDMVTTAAGLASCGLKPFASTFAIFTERAWEQVRNAVARPRMNVKIVGSHGGIMTGEDGASAHAICDVSIYRTLPNMTVVVPGDAVEAREATLALADHEGPGYLKLTRAAVPLNHADDWHDFRLGKAEVLRDGDDVALLACGSMLGLAMDAADHLAAEGTSARVVNVSTIKPLDVDTVVTAAAECGAVVTCEDHNIVGGLGAAVAECLGERRPTVMRRVGVEDRFTESGTPAVLYERFGLTSARIAEAARDVVKAR